MKRARQPRVWISLAVGGLIVAALLVIHAADDAPPAKRGLTARAPAAHEPDTPLLGSGMLSDVTRQAEGPLSTAHVSGPGETTKVASAEVVRPPEILDGRGVIKGLIHPPIGFELSNAALAGSTVQLYFDRRHPDVSCDLTFTFDDLEPGVHHLTLRVPGFQVVERDVVVQTSVVTKVDLMLEVGATLQGHVRDEGGRGIPWARLEVVVQAIGPSGPLSVSGEANENGDFRIEGISAGRAHMYASSPGFCEARVELGDLVPSDNRTGLELILALGRRLGGRIWKSSGSPAAGAVVEVRSQQPGSIEQQDIRSHPDGSFFASGLGVGPFRVTSWLLQSNGSFEVACARDVPGGTDDLELQLAPPGRIELAMNGAAEIQIRDLVGLAPPPEGDLLQQRSDRPRWVSFPRKHGIVIEGLAAGDYWVLASNDRDRVAARTRIRVDSALVAHAEVVLLPATRLTIRAPQNWQPIVVCASDGFLWPLRPDGILLSGGAMRASELLPDGAYRIQGRGGDHPYVKAMLSGRALDVVLK